MDGTTEMDDERLETFGRIFLDRLAAVGDREIKETILADGFFNPSSEKKPPGAAKPPAQVWEETSKSMPITPGMQGEGRRSLHVASAIPNRCGAVTRAPQRESRPAWPDQGTKRAAILTRMFFRIAISDGAGTSRTQKTRPASRVERP
jgi:hypothetical protein